MPLFSHIAASLLIRCMFFYTNYRCIVQPQQLVQNVDSESDIFTG